MRTTEISLIAVLMISIVVGCRQVDDERGSLQCSIKIGMSLEAVQSELNSRGISYEMLDPTKVYQTWPEGFGGPVPKYLLRGMIGRPTIGSEERKQDYIILCFDENRQVDEMICRRVASPLQSGKQEADR